MYVLVLYLSNSKEIVYNSTKNTSELETLKNIQKEKEIVSPVTKAEVTHVKTPENVKAIYISSWTAGSKTNRDKIIKMIDDTELNSVIIDVKDSTGKISFPISDKNISVYGASEKRITDVDILLKTLHDKNIYVIARIAVFQDNHLTKENPDLSLKSKATGKPWKDRKGLSFLDPTNKEVQDYIVNIARYSHSIGFDEVNFDYIRYPSDGNIKDIDYKLSNGATRSDNIEKFFKYLNSELKKNPDIIMSADLFGLTTEVKDDLGIGQVWEKALPYFDYLSPMVYPSHYSSSQSGFSNSSEHPYEIVNKAMIGAVKKTNLANDDIKKIRPWLQDFDLGSVYTADKVRAQIKASSDNKINSWMLWDPSNKYTESALEVN